MLLETPAHIQLGRRWPLFGRIEQNCLEFARSDDRCPGIVAAGGCLASAKTLQQALHQGLGEQNRIITRQPDTLARLEVAQYFTPLVAIEIALVVELVVQCVCQQRVGKSINRLEFIEGLRGRLAGCAEALRNHRANH
nr:hypothetical protein [Pseudomonas sp. BIGb0427]